MTRRDHRLRLGQSALGRQGVRARGARGAASTCAIVVTADPAPCVAADRIVLPGVGAFADCRRGLDARAGHGRGDGGRLSRARRPFLGICVGMQLMATRGLEYGT